MSIIPELKLRSATGELKMPVVGMGTACDPFDEAELKAAVMESIRLGYRHFDTAALYRTEKALGEAIAEAIKLGLIESRSQLFITSKLWCTDAHPHLVLPALQSSLNVKPGKKAFPPPKEDLLPMDYKSVWAAMEECQRLGLTKSIGVSNFSCAKLQNLLSFASIAPSVNQVEMSPVWQQKKLREYCEANNIVITAYSPLGAKGCRWGTSQVMDDETLKEIAHAHGKTIAQICLRWLLEQGLSIVVKSVKKERLMENIQILDWELSQDDRKRIEQIPQRRLQPKEQLVSLNGPFKSLLELWDGDI